MNKWTRTVLVIACAVILIVAAFFLIRSCNFDKPDTTTDPTEIVDTTDDSNPSTESSAVPSVPSASNPTEPSQLDTTNPTFSTEPPVTVPPLTIPPKTEPVKVELQSITVGTAPEKVIYYEGDSLDHSGLTLIAKYSDGSEQTISSGFSCFPLKLNEVGSTSIAVQYGGCTATFKVIVQEVRITKIAVRNMPDKTVYQEGETLDITGLTLTAYYNNGREEIVTEGFTVPQTILSCGEPQQITVSYADVSTSFYVQVTHTIIASGICGDSLTWEVGSCGTLIISGSGQMYDYTKTGRSPWEPYDIRRASLPDGLMNIGDHAFYWCDEMTEISIPNSVETIGVRAFSWCSALVSITIPDSVTEIGDHAFEASAKLSSVCIGKGVHSIGLLAFRDCPNLNGVFVYEGNSRYASDERGTLLSKDGTELILFPRNITGAYTVPDGVVRIRDFAFQGCSLREVIIPDSVVEIDNYAFKDSNSLSCVTIGSGVKEIHIDAFDDCDVLYEMYVLSMDCNIAGSTNTLGDPWCMVIFGYSGSTAQHYAEKYGYEFVNL